MIVQANEYELVHPCIVRIIIITIIIIIAIVIIIIIREEVGPVLRKHSELVCSFGDCGMGWPVEKWSFEEDWWQCLDVLVAVFDVVIIVYFIEELIDL